LELVISDQLNIQHSLLIKNQHMKEPIDRFDDGFSTKI